MFLYMGTTTRPFSQVTKFDCLPISTLVILTLIHHFLLAEDEDADGRRHSHPRPWSLIARKGTRSESSSFIQQEIDDVEDAESFLSPRLLPTLFSDKHLSDVPASPLSPLSIDTREQRVSSPEHMSSLMLPTPPPDLDPGENLLVTHIVRRDYTEDVCS